MLTLTRFSFVFLLGGSLFLTGCSKDEDDVTVDMNISVNNDLEGSWEVTSFTADGVEAMESLVLSWDLEFETQGPDEGEMKSIAILYDGSTSVDKMDYEIQNEGREIEIEEDDLEITVSDNELTMSGIFEGERVIIEADRD